MFEIKHEDGIVESSLIPEGGYEVIIKSASFSETKNGKQYIDLPLIIRNDIEQPRKNSYIFHTMWQKKEPSEADMAVGGYSVVQLQILCRAANLTNGKKYETLEQLFSELKGMLLYVEVKHEEYNGKTNAKVGYIEQTKYPVCNHIMKVKSTSAGPAIIPDTVDVFNAVPESELPF